MLGRSAGARSATPDAGTSYPTIRDRARHADKHLTFEQEDLLGWRRQLKAVHRMEQQLCGAEDSNNRSPSPGQSSAAPQAASSGSCHQPPAGSPAWLAGQPCGSFSSGNCNSITALFAHMQGEFCEHRASASAAFAAGLYAGSVDDNENDGNDNDIAWTTCRQVDNDIDDDNLQAGDLGSQTGVDVSQQLQHSFLWEGVPTGSACRVSSALAFAARQQLLHMHNAQQQLLWEQQQGQKRAKRLGHAARHLMLLMKQARGGLLQCFRRAFRKLGGSVPQDYPTSSFRQLTQRDIVKLRQQLLRRGANTAGGADAELDVVMLESLQLGMTAAAAAVNVKTKGAAGNAAAGRVLSGPLEQALCALGTLTANAAAAAEEEASLEEKAKTRRSATPASGDVMLASRAEGVSFDDRRQVAAGIWQLHTGLFDTWCS
jgi:hypothetical protein